jgi:hypothetical protein
VGNRDVGEGSGGREDAGEDGNLHVDDSVGVSGLELMGC